ncbi:UNVERIFIED_ORG: hypothetical protein C7432_3708 [Pantoea allii]|jgi:hypothetical protein|nr:hypothetical protein CG433_06805 [Pantoea ananatis]PQL06275.1 hypothetical protein CG436_15735 [Pantoea ananatis]SFX34447.1 hypothetical protein SAMN03097714_1668 [Pantoea ananatis]
MTKIRGAMHHAVFSLQQQAEPLFSVVTHKGMNQPTRESAFFCLKTDHSLKGTFNDSSRYRR